MKKVWKRSSEYIKYELRDIVWPRSLPNPPEYKEPRKLTWREIFQGVRNGTREYMDTWRAPKEAEPDVKEAPKEPTISEELAAAARSAQGMKPVLLKFYYAQMNAYQLSIQNFIQGYREGVSEKVNLDAWLNSQDRFLDDQKPSSSANQEEETRAKASCDASDSQQAVQQDSPAPDANLSSQELQLDQGDRENGMQSEIQYMDHGEIEDWNAQIMAQQNQASKMAQDSMDNAREASDFDALQKENPAMAQQLSKLMESAANSQDVVSNAANARDESISHRPQDLQLSTSNATDLEQDVSDALAQAERLSAIMMSGKFSSKQMAEFRAAIDRADALLSSAKS